MALCGTLDDFNFAEVLQLVNLARKTGTLTVRCGSQQAVLHLREGQAIDAVMGDKEGQQVIYQLLGWEQGQFEFTRSQAAVRPTIHDRTENLIMEGVRRLDELHQLQREFPHMGSVLRKTARAAEAFEQLSQEECRLLTMVDAQRDVSAIMRESGIEPLKIASAISRFLELGLVEVWSQEGSPVKRAPAEASVSNYFGKRKP
jgi:hypothetical protein